METANNQKKIYQFTVVDGYNTKTVVETHAEDIFKALSSASDYVLNKKLSITDLFVRISRHSETLEDYKKMLSEHNKRIDISIISIVQI